MATTRVAPTGVVLRGRLLEDDDVLAGQEVERLHPDLRKGTVLTTRSRFPAYRKGQSRFPGTGTVQHIERVAKRIYGIPEFRF